MLSPCLSLCLDLQCFTWLGKMVQRFIDTHFQRSAVRLRFRGCLAFSWTFFHVSGILLHPTNICFIARFLKNFQNSSFNEPDSSCYSILSPGMPRLVISDLNEPVIFNSSCMKEFGTHPFHEDWWGGGGRG